MGLRKTGINVIGDVPWGTHISYIYSSKDGNKDHHGIIASCIKEGLLHNELCVWIYSQNTSYQEIKEAIKEVLADVDNFTADGQLKILPYTKWYVEDNTFNELRVNKHWSNLIKYAMENGFEGIRAVGDTAWLEKSSFRSFANYERNINNWISDMPFIAVCLYDESKLDILQFADIINNHDYIIIKDHGELKLLKNIELLIKCEQLEQTKADYQNLLTLLPDAVFIHDYNKIYYCNQAAKRIFGVNDPKELRGKSVKDLIAEKDRNSYDKFMEQLLSRKLDPCFLQCKIINKNGELKNVELVGTRYFYNGLPGVLSVARDISPLKRIIELERDIRKNTELLKETLEYDKVKTEFFSIISHELRTPLNIILSALQLMDKLKKDVPEENKEKKYLKMMRQNCYRLLRLVNNIIDITKIDSDHFELDLKNCNIVEIVENITLSVAEYIKSKGIKLQFDTDTEEKVIACDPDQIERIILNLLSNAVKFTPSGGNIWVNLYNVGNKVVITVKDNGVGIPKDKQKFIFNRFQQVENLFNRHHEGSGIGLALVKSLVEKHGGKISVKSKVGKGSIFIIKLPCKTLHQPKCDVNLLPSMTGHNFVERAYIEFSDIYI